MQSVICKDFSGQSKGSWDMTTKSAASRGTTVWSIGDDALDPGQFSHRWYGDPDDNPVFQVGTSEPAVDWPAFQPGPLNAATGFRSTEAIVVFDLDPGLADLVLLVDIYAAQGPCPELELELNGHRGLFYFNVARDRRSDIFTLSPTAGTAHLEIELPADGFVTEGNRLIVRTVAVEPAADEELQPLALPSTGSLFGSGITWRRLALLAGSEVTTAAVTCEPLPLYEHTETGGLVELVEVRMRAGLGTGPISGTLELDNHIIDVTLDLAGRDFGDARALVPVPELETLCAAKLTLRSGDQVRTEEFTFKPARKWTLHLLPHVHLDVGFTDVQAKVLELHARNLERTTAIFAEYPEYAFTVDGSYILDEFLKTRDEAALEPVVQAMTNGGIGVNAFSTLFLSGLASLEELFRSAVRGMSFRDRYGAQITHGHLTDVPSYSWALPNVLRAMGLDGFFGIQNHARGGNADSDVLQLQSPVRWVGPGGVDVLAYFACHYVQLRLIAADPPTVPGMTDAFCRLLRRYERDDYLPTDLPIVGTHVDNEDLGDGYADVAHRWNARFAYPKLVFDTIGGYLASVAPLRDRLPQVIGDGGSYWEDGAGTQAAAIAAYRTAQTGLVAAETVNALAALSYPGLRPDLESLDDAWDALLFGCEHTWTAAHVADRPHSPDVVDQADWKIHQIQHAGRLMIDLGRRGMSQLAETARLRAPAILIANPSARRRDVTVVHELPVASRIVDSRDDAELPVEVVAYDGEVGPRDGYVLGRFTVPDVPAFGYRSVRTELAETPLEAGTLDRSTALQAARYRLRIDPATGRLTSLVHRSTGTELLDADSPYTLGEVLYITGGGDALGRGRGDQMSRLVLNAPNLPEAVLTLHPATVRYVGHRKAPDGDVLRFAGEAPTIPQISTEIRLFDNSDRVEVTVDLSKEHELAKESVYVAFPFAVPDPTLRYDRQIGWVDPSRDTVPGGCHDWYCVQSGAAVTNAGGGIVWASADAPLLCADDIVRGRWATSSQPRTGTLLSWVMNNYWFTNTPASQGGRATFRYAFTPTSDWDQAFATRFVRGLRSPVLVNEITEQDRIRDDASVQSSTEGVLLDVDVPGSVDLNVYAARSAQGLMLRVEELAGEAATASVTPPRGLTAQLCRGDEKPLGGLPVEDDVVQIPLKPYEVATVLLSSAVAGSQPQ